MTALRQSAVCLLSLLAAGCDPAIEADAGPSPIADRYLGSNVCADCHETEYAQWRGSHHQLAMQNASADTVLADFDDSAFDYYGTTTRFVRDGDDFVVRTQNAQGEADEYRVTHTFGVEPLQQYLVEFPGGRMQALPFLWDTRPESEGGQRWYHLYEDEYVGPGDPLHWTGRYFNWNVMCAECHSTNVQLGYDISANAFETTWDEISVGCEACHGPGARHVQQARTSTFDGDIGLAVNLDDARGTGWVIDSESGIAALSSPRAPQQQPESCGRCHARRSVLTEDYAYGRPLTDTHLPSLLEDGLYFADGRILGEVYVYGSFLQSAMYRAGVTCTDCHNPHTAELVTGPEPNDVCSQCHLPTVFATSEHSGTDSVACVDCHMQARIYMGVDDRRDHSFRLPDIGPDHYGHRIAAGRAGEGTDGELCARPGGQGEVQEPAIVSATLLTLLAPPFTAGDLQCIEAGLRSDEPLERIGALRAIRQMAADQRLRSGTELLRDEIRGVRVEAARTYADLRDLLPLEDGRAFGSAANEYRESLLLSASMPESATLMAEFESRLGNERASGEWTQHALLLDPDFAPALHARGLQRIRAGMPELALEDFRRAANLEPGVPRYAYVYGVALNSMGQPDDAISVLRAARQRFPGDFDIGWGLATMLRDADRIPESRQIVGEMLRLDPDNPNLEALMRSLDDQP